MKTANQLSKEIYENLNEILRRYKEKLDLCTAEETHGEELDEDFIADKVQELEDVIEHLDVISDLSYIE